MCRSRGSRTAAQAFGGAALEALVVPRRHLVHVDAHGALTRLTARVHACRNKTNTHTHTPVLSAISPSDGGDGALLSDDGGEDQGAEEVTVHGAEGEESSRRFWKRAVSLATGPLSVKA